MGLADTTNMPLTIRRRSEPSRDDGNSWVDTATLVLCQTMYGYMCGSYSQVSKCVGVIGTLYRTERPAASRGTVWTTISHWLRALLILLLWPWLLAKPTLGRPPIVRGGRRATLGRILSAATAKEVSFVGHCGTLLTGGGCRFRQVREGAG